jgi:hypothetical protein
LFAKSMLVMLLLNPLRLACAGGSIKIDELEARLREEDAKLEAMGFTAAEIASGKQLMAALPAFNAADSECTICLDVLSNATQTPCNHIFCKECIVGVINSKPGAAKCPICRSIVTLAGLCRPFAVADDIVAEDDVPAEAKAAAAAVAAAETIFDAKTSALIEQLNIMHASDPEAKALVFSQFLPSLALLKTRLTQEGIVWKSITADMNGTISSFDQISMFFVGIQLGVCCVFHQPIVVAANSRHSTKRRRERCC